MVALIRNETVRDVSGEARLSVCFLTCLEALNVCLEVVGSFGAEIAPLEPTKSTVFQNAWLEFDQLDINLNRIVQ